jgi:hypothetical protein
MELVKMVILPLLKQKALAKDMPFARSLKGLNIEHMHKEPLFKITQLWLLLEVWHN